MLSQRDGVYSAVVSFMKEKGRHFEDGMKVELSKEDRSTIVEMISVGIASNSIVFSEKATGKYSSDKAINGYCSNLLSNWLRRDERLNGNTQYKPKNPGSRFGLKDEIIKNLRALAKNTVDEGQRAAVELEISKRQAVLRIEKLKAKTKIDTHHIPESLQHLIK